MSAGARFRALMAEGGGLLTPGCHDALSARIAAHAGARAVAISGFGVEAALLGRPDIGLLTLGELVDTARRITDVVDVPVTCDGEAGFGGVHSIARLVRALEAAGIAGVQIEDQASPKRCPALDGRSVVPVEEAIARLRAAIDARCDVDFLIIARSDADVVSTAELVERCNRYLAAGADMAMPICFTVDGRPLSALDADAQMALFERIALDIDGPVKAAIIPHGYTAKDMGRIGYAVVGLTGGAIEAQVNALHGAYAAILETGSEDVWRAAHPPRFPAPSGIAGLLGIDADLARERRAAGEE